MSQLELMQEINPPMPRYWNLCLDDFYGPREVLTLLLTVSPALSVFFPLLQLYPRNKHPIMVI